MRINEILRKENLGKVYQIAGYTQKGEYLVKEYNGHVYLESRENFKKIEENFFLDDISGMRFKEVIDWTKVPVDTLVEVSDDGKGFIKRYFAKYESGVIFAWGDGRSSKTAYGKSDVVRWKMANIIRE